MARAMARFEVHRSRVGLDLKARQLRARFVLGVQPLGPAPIAARILPQLAQARKDFAFIGLRQSLGGRLLRTVNRAQRFLVL